MGSLRTDAPNYSLDLTIGERAQEAKVVVSPQGHHIGPYALSWLQMNDVELPPDHSCNDAGVKPYQGREFVCMRDEGIAQIITAPEVFGITALHQLMESPLRHDARLERSVIATLRARFALMARIEDYDNVCEWFTSKNPAARANLQGCSEFALTANTMMLASDLPVVVHGVKRNVETHLSIRSVHNPWNFGVAIVDTGTTAERHGLRMLEEFDYHSPPVQLTALWREGVR